MSGRCQSACATVMGTSSRIRKLMDTTGWKPRYDLESGLGRLLEWEGLL